MIETPSPKAVAEVWAVALAHELSLDDLRAVRTRITNREGDDPTAACIRDAWSAAEGRTPNEADVLAVGSETIRKIGLLIQPIGS
jgi:hypothetical protein